MPRLALAENLAQAVIWLRPFWLRPFSGSGWIVSGRFLAQAVLAQAVFWLRPFWLRPFSGSGRFPALAGLAQAVFWPGPFSGSGWIGSGRFWPRPDLTWLRLAFGPSWFWFAAAFNLQSENRNQNEDLCFQFPATAIKHLTLTMFRQGR